LKTQRKELIFCIFELITNQNKRKQL
jgi:hypothetical protein